MDVIIIPILKDNYAYLLLSGNGETAVVDPGEAAPVIAELEKRGLELDYILSTHHHADHIGGNTDLMNRYNKAKLVGPAAEQDRIDNMDIQVHDGDILSFGAEDFKTIATPGHTRGAVCYYFPRSQIVFTGDTLFSLSCGRLFEGTPEEMWNSLQKLAALPDETKMYCGHEYTLSNAEFCLKIEPENIELKKRLEHVRGLREKNLPSLPSTIGLEKKANAFLRAGSAENFAHIRKLKDAG